MSSRHWKPKNLLRRSLCKETSILGLGNKHVLAMLRLVCVYLVASFASPGCGTLLGIHLLFHWCTLCWFLQCFIYTCGCDAMYFFWWLSPSPMGPGLWAPPVTICAMGAQHATSFLKLFFACSNLRFPFCAVDLSLRCLFGLLLV